MLASPLNIPSHLHLKARAALLSSQVCHDETRRAHRISPPSRVMCRGISVSVMERVYQIDQMLAGRKAVSRQELLERLEISWATLKRDLAYMKDRLNAPIVFDRELGGYRFNHDNKQIGPQYELPGLWFSAEEIHALLTMQHLLSNLDTGGLLGPQIKPLLARLTGMLGAADNPIEEVQKRIQIQTVGARQFHLDHFQAVGSALLRRKRLIIRYHARGSDQITEREISPQRLVHYRDNWYLDAWCHLRDGLRAFAVDAIQHAEILDSRANDVDEAQLNAMLGAGGYATATWHRQGFDPIIATNADVESKVVWEDRENGESQPVSASLTFGGRTFDFTTTHNAAAQAAFIAAAADDPRYVVRQAMTTLKTLACMAYFDDAAVRATGPTPLARALVASDRARALALAREAAPLLPAAATWLAGQVKRR